MSWRERFKLTQQIRAAAASSSRGEAEPPGLAEEESDTDDEDGPATTALTPSAASQALLDFLIACKLSNRSCNARVVCTIAHLACKAGATGAVEQLAANPLLTGGHHSEHFDKVVGISDMMQGRTMDSLTVPGYARNSIGRTLLTYSASLVYDTLASELASLTDMASQVRQSAADLGALYSEHPVVAANPAELFVPVALYQDGVSFQWDRHDGCVGFWVVNLVTSRRHLAVVTKKSLRCRCGCGGWCNNYACFRYLAWLFKVMLSGKYPNQRYDGTGWGVRREMGGLSGQSLGYKAVCVMVKGDWMEYAVTMGFNMWNHKTNPCFICCAKSSSSDAPPEERMDCIDHISPIGTAWPLKDDKSYDAACRQCETQVHIQDVSTFTRLIASLRADRRKTGSHGRTLVQDFPSLGLRQGMRLEPSADHPDIYGVDEFIEAWPIDGVSLVFWDPTREDGARHRNPLFQDGTGVHRNCMAPDELHTMHQGVLGDFVAWAVWRIIDEDALHVGSAGTAENSHRLRAEVLQSELDSWYAMRRRDGYDTSEIRATLQQSIGTCQNPAYSGKAAPSADLVRFTVHILRRCRQRLEHGNDLLAAGEALEQYLAITRTSGVRLSVTAQQRLVDGCITFRRAAIACGMRFRPKMHLYVHLVVSAGRYGNPRIVTSTWADEDLNSDLAAVARSAHSLVWSKRILAVFSHESGPTAQRTRKQPRLT